MAWSPDRRRVYISAADGSGAAMVDVSTGRAIQPLSSWVQHPYAVAPVADVAGRAIIYTDEEGVLQRREMTSAAVVATSVAEPPLVRYGVAVSGDGRSLATAAENFTPDSADHFVDIHDAKTLDASIRLGPLDFGSYWLWLSADGSLLVASSFFPGRRLELWDTRTGQRRWFADGALAGATAIVLSPDGRTLAAGNIRGVVVTVDLATGAVRSQYALQTSMSITSMEFSPDGTILAFSGDDGQVHLLEADTLAEIGLLPMPNRPEWTFVTFDPGTARMSAVDERGRIVQWDTSPAAWIDRACDIVGRNLDQAEWERYLPGVEYERTCPGVS